MEEEAQLWDAEALHESPRRVMTTARHYFDREMNRIRLQAVDLASGGQSHEQIVVFIRSELRALKQTLAALGAAMSIVDRASREAMARGGAAEDEDRPRK